ncbi:MAG: hypothetical protein AAFY56_17970, partial [Pseudomonadota bacterium]
LELGVELGLSLEQRNLIQGIYEEMQVEALDAGLAFIAAEQALDEGFRAGDLSNESLLALINAAEAKRAELRFIHLSRHLQTIDYLSEDQVSRYAELRGYRDDLCDRVPEGHNVEMWRKHNGCE